VGRLKVPRNAGLGKAGILRTLKPCLMQKSAPPASPELAMAGRCFSAKVRQSFFSDPFSLQPKQLQPDYVSSHDKSIE